VPAPVWVEPKGHLLPFCSHTILKHPEKRGRSNYQEGTDIYPSFRTVFARSEGYNQSPETTHNPKVVRLDDGCVIYPRKTKLHWRPCRRKVVPSSVILPRVSSNFARYEQLPDFRQAA